jgi:hypothetical protein
MGKNNSLPSEKYLSRKLSEKLRTDVTNINVYNQYYADNKRLCGSFEYIGIL